MQDFILSGRAVDVVLAVIALEFCLLVIVRGRGRRARVAIDSFFALAPGAILLLALRAALAGWGWVAIAGLIALSFPFHLADLWRRRL
jgi:hypothetical protein